MDMPRKKITDFLHTSRSPRELAIALSVLHEFKACESLYEWSAIPFLAWAKFEQLEEFLAYLVDGSSLQTDTRRYMEE